MSFASVEYFSFLGIVSILYFSLPQRFRWIWILSASYYFYASWNLSYLVLIIFSTLIDYCVGFLIGITDIQSQMRRRLLLLLSITTNLSVLFIFKYYNFFADSFEVVLQQLELPYLVPHLNVLLPVGISFYTFQSMSYTIDVYKNEISVEKHFGIFATFISFFPQLVAGPIERAKNLLPQFKVVMTIDYVRITSGLKLIAWGLFKKAVIADRISILVNSVYTTPREFSGFQMIVATLAFSIQIYCDFSGYSDIAVGSARILGFDLMENFKQPYFSKSISEFWRRWHISLSTWFRDYVYIQLGGNRVSAFRWQFNLLIVFILSGIWHGANWTFFIWGALHGLFLVMTIHLSPILANLLRRLRLNDSKFFIDLSQTALTYVIVCFAWIFFRANSLNEALYIASNLFYDVDILLQNILSIQFFQSQLAQMGVSRLNFLIITLSVSILLYVDYIKTYKPILLSKIERLPLLLRWSFYYIAIATILVFGIFGDTQFIYFQF